MGALTLSRLLLAWLPVAAWLLLVAIGLPRLTGAPGPSKRMLWWRGAEAALLTMFASLWFDSLGSGGWWLLFLLLGVLCAVPPRLATADGPFVKGALLGTIVDVAAYIVAGGILAWRLR